MQEVFEKIIWKLEEQAEECRKIWNEYDDEEPFGAMNAYTNAIEIVKQEAERCNNGWIPCSERLPKERDWYLTIFQEVDTGFIGIPYIADYLMGKHTQYTTDDGWIIKNCTDVQNESTDYYKKLRCVAWQPLPQPYEPKGE